MEKTKIIEISKFESSNGSLYPIELVTEIPFAVKRVYVLKGVPKNATRGGHAHLIEKEVFVCVAGSCKCFVDDDGKGKRGIILDSPQKAIFVDRNVWHEFEDFSNDAILLAFSSTEYLPGPGNYLEDYDKFCKKF